MTSRNSTPEPGQPCVSTRGRASGSGERTCRKWTLAPSIVVVNCGELVRLGLVLAPVVAVGPVGGQLGEVAQRHPAGPAEAGQLVGPAYNRRLRRAAPLVAAISSALATCSPSWCDQWRLLDATPVPCGTSRQTVRPWREGQRTLLQLGACGYRRVVVPCQGELTGPNCWAELARRLGAHSRPLMVGTDPEPLDDRVQRPRLGVPSASGETAVAAGVFCW
jgi:hypothetical protein